jgi:hypothetical protein
MPKFKPILNDNLVGLSSYTVANLMCPIGSGWNTLIPNDLFDPVTI